ncbi:hypothetical protein VO69_14925 [Aeromonas salmonicida]|nr:hypothetical protein VO69_14925 [Aeromonas salmonicida]
MKRRPNDYCDTQLLIVLSVGCGSHPNVEQSYNKPDGRIAIQMSPLELIGADLTWFDALA